MDACGYARVSAKEQNEDQQFVTLRKASISGQDIFKDKQSGKDFKRLQYKKLVKKLKPNNLLYIKSIDWLGYNYGEILERRRIVTKEKNIGTLALDIPLLDTRRARI